MGKYIGEYVDVDCINKDDKKVEKAMLLNIIKLLEGDDSLIRYINAIVESAKLKGM